MTATNETPVTTTIAEGLDALTNGQGFGIEHQRAFDLANAAPEMYAALGYVEEQIDLTRPRYKDADDSDTVTIEVTVGWLREVRDARAKATEHSKGAGEADAATG